MSLRGILPRVSHAAGKGNALGGSARKKGFTLVEVLVAAMIFAIGMLFGIAVFVYGLKSVARAQEKAFCHQEVVRALELATRTITNVYSSTPQLIQNPNSGQVYTVQVINSNLTAAAYADRSTSRIVWATIVKGNAVHGLNCYHDPRGASSPILYEAASVYVIGSYPAGMAYPGALGWPAEVQYNT